VSEGLCAGLGIISRKLAVAIGGGDGNIGDLAAGKAAGVGTQEPHRVRSHETLTLLRDPNANPNRKEFQPHRKRAIKT
jgi:hypothetical protein